MPRAHEYMLMLMLERFFCGVARVRSLCSGKSDGTGVCANRRWHRMRCLFVVLVAVVVLVVVVVVVVLVLSSSKRGGAAVPPIYIYSYLA